MRHPYRRSVPTFASIDLNSPTSAACDRREPGVRRPRIPRWDAVGRRIEWNNDTWEIAGVTGDVPACAAERSVRR
jgi:hypothetical protein